jgi:hypothetical protein
MKNSTQQILKDCSNKLTERTPHSELRANNIAATNYLTHDFDNLYRTSYNDMDKKVTHKQANKK